MENFTMPSMISNATFTSFADSWNVTRAPLGTKYSTPRSISKESSQFWVSDPMVTASIVTNICLDNTSVSSGDPTCSVGINSTVLNEIVVEDPEDGIALLKQPAHMVVILTLAYMLVFVLAVVNNSLVACVICRNPQMRTITNYFLCNLAVADITVSFLVLPFTPLSNIFAGWLFGSFLCKAIPYLQAVAVSASVNTLTAVALERYFAIFYPHRVMINTQRAMMVIVVIWLIPICIQTPWAIFQVLEEFGRPPNTLLICYPKFPSEQFSRLFFLGVVFLTCYILPLCLLTVFYSLIALKVWQRNVTGIRGSKAERSIQRSKIRMVRMLIAVAVTFALSWLPLYSIRMRMLFGPPLEGQERKVVVNVLVPIAQWLGSANSSVNPFIYCYFSESFRKNILALLRRCLCCSKIAAVSQGYNRTTTTTVI